MARWNSQASAYSDKLGSVIDRSSAVKAISRYALVAAISAATSRYGLAILYWLSVPHAGLIGQLLAALSVFSASAALIVLGRWQESRSRAKRQATLGPGQRALLGLPPMPPPKLDATRPAAAPAAAQPAAALLGTPLTPQRMTTPLGASRAGYESTTPQQQLLASVTSSRSARTASPGSRYSPFSSGTPIATPEQLQHLMEAWPPGAPGGGAATPPGAGGSGGGSSGFLYPSLQGYGAADGGGVDQGELAGLALPLGKDAPLYRPSLLPRKVAASGAGGGGDTLQPSADAEATLVMKDILGMEVPELLVWIERFREWLSASVLKPLLHLVDNLHTQVNKQLQEAGEHHQQLPSLAAIIEGQAPGGGGEAGALAEAFMARCLAALHNPRMEVRTQPILLAQQQELLLGLVQSLNRHKELLHVLLGKRPGDLLPPSPPGYLLGRLRQLAAGTCCKDYTWNGGGRWQGRPWSSELPTDSGVVMYVVAAFLDAPGWQFTVPGMPEGSRGAPLYMGSIPSRPPVQYSALLSYRPEKPGPGAVAVIGSNLASLEPRFSLLIQGSMITLAERDGLFKTLIMFLRYHQLQRQGMVAGRLLSEEAFGGLDEVLTPADLLPTVPQRVFNWWFPAYHVA